MKRAGVIFRAGVQSETTAFIDGISINGNYNFRNLNLWSPFGFDVKAAMSAFGRGYNSTFAKFLKCLCSKSFGGINFSRYTFEAGSPTFFRFRGYKYCGPNGVFTGF